MDSREFLQRFIEAQRQAGGQPVEVEFAQINGAGCHVSGHVSIEYLATTGIYATELTRPRIIITYRP